MTAERRLPAKSREWTRNQKAQAEGRAGLVPLFISIHFST